MGDAAMKGWATDYDVFDPAYVADPFPVWDELRATDPKITPPSCVTGCNRAANLQVSVMPIRFGGRLPGSDDI